jgi:hypothetical protein
MFAPFKAIEAIERLVRPVLTGVQLLPLSVDKNTPPLIVPAKMFKPLVANDVTMDVSPVLTDVQLAPLLVDRNTPPVVAAKIFAPIDAMAVRL